MNHRIGIWTVREEAGAIARHLAAELPGQDRRHVSGDAGSNSETFSRIFGNHSQWVLVMATGIAVRYLNGKLTHKSEDPGVVVLDDACRFSISLVGGHEGGANELAYRVAEITSAVPVVTTATEAIKPLVLGVGCRKAIQCDRLDGAIRDALAGVQHSLSDVRELVTVDVKGREPGLREWCEAYGIPLRTFTRQQINERHWTGHPSEWVWENLGVPAVSEPCALLAAHRGSLILRKEIKDGVTVSILKDQLHGGEKRHGIT